MNTRAVARSDVASPQAIVDAVYEILSGRAGEVRDNPGGEVIRGGANSIQLWNDGSRWWILSAMWDAVSAELTDSG